VLWISPAGPSRQDLAVVQGQNAVRDIMTKFMSCSTSRIVMPKSSRMSLMEKIRFSFSSSSSPPKFVQEKDFRLQAKSAPQLDQFLGSVGRFMTNCSGRLQLQEIDDVLHFLGGADLLPRGRELGLRTCPGPEAGLYFGVPAQHQVVHGGHAEKSSMFWNVRAIPAWATWWGFSG